MKEKGIEWKIKNGEKHGKIWKKGKEQSKKWKEIRK